MYFLRVRKWKEKDGITDAVPSMTLICNFLRSRAVAGDFREGASLDTLGWAGVRSVIVAAH